MVIFSKVLGFVLCFKEIKATVKLLFSKYQSERLRSWKGYFFLVARFHKTRTESCRTKWQVKMKKGYFKKKKKKSSISIFGRKVLCDIWLLINFSYLSLWKKGGMLWRVTKTSLLLSNLIFSSWSSCMENWSALPQISLVAILFFKSRKRRSKLPQEKKRKNNLLF